MSKMSLAQMLFYELLRIQTIFTITNFKKKWLRLTASDVFIRTQQSELELEMHSRPPVSVSCCLTVLQQLKVIGA